MSIPVGLSYEYMNVILDARYHIGLTKVNKTDAGDSKTSAGGGANTGAKLYQIGYGHALSKRTSASLTYARMDNDSAGSYNLTGNTAATSGDNSSVFVLGLVHTF